MKYRQYFGLSPKQFREEVDLQTFLIDIDMMTIESESQNVEKGNLPNEEISQNY